MTMCSWRAICHIGLLACIATTIHGRSLDRTASCPDGFEKRLITLPDNETIQRRCCHPISLCGPGHEVVDCSVDYGVDQCQACPKGLVQPMTSSSSSRWNCVKPGLTCAEEAVERELAGTRSCQCNAERGYCGLPTDCKKKEPQCEPGLILHHESCHCVAPVTNPTSKSSTVASGPLTATTPNSALPTSENRQDIQETASKTPLDVMPSQSDAEVTFSTPASSSPANAVSLGWILGPIFGILGLLLLLVTIFILCRSRHSSSIHQGSTFIYKITSIVNIGLNRSTGSHDNRTDARPAAPENEENDETVPKSASPICEEENRGQQEEEGPGVNPQEPLLKPPGDCIPINPTL